MGFFVIRSELSGNQELALSLAEWTFKTCGVLRVGEIKHHRVGESTPPAAYTIEEQVVSNSDQSAGFH